MAGNKINNKAKGKEDKSKLNKGASQTTEDAEDMDYALLRKPISTSVTGLAQARKIFDFATEELKNLLSTECDLLYECKVCRNLFRSLANFISHKRIYCKEKFNSSIHSHFINPTCTSTEIMKIKRLEQEYQETLKLKNNQECVETDETMERIPLTKDLTEIIEKISLKTGFNHTIKEDQELILQKIPKSSVAVYQNINFNDSPQCDIRSQVNELDAMLSQNKAVLQIDGKFKIQNSIEATKSNVEPENIIQISDDDENEDIGVLKCKICDLQFSTQKTLRFHMKYKHLESRLVYPCPDCLDIFSTSWSVYRHLFKVHRKTAAQIRRQRESIQAKAFRMNNPPAYYEKRKNNIKSSSPQKITEEERLDQENQAWMDNMEGDGEIPRCGGCGRTFERRAALAAHTHTCQPRSRALARRADTKKIEIQIRKDYNKGPAGLSLPVKTTDANDNKLIREEVQLTPKPSSNDVAKEEPTTEPLVNNQEERMDTASPTSDKINNEKKTLNNLEHFIPKLPFAQQAEKNNLTALKARLQPDTDLDSLLCKKCDIKHNNIQDLYEHMASHYKWLRYACKLCNFKHYNFEKLPEHVKIVHKLKGDTDFYFSTVKAVDANEALELCEPEVISDTNGTSPDSRRPSRCSSDSSRLSDDSSSSSTRIEIGAKKRKMNNRRSIIKKKKDIISIDEDVDNKCNDVLPEKESVTEIETCNLKNFEENSSDIDDNEEKIVKKQLIGETSLVHSRRPVRKRTRPKNEDYVYDLSKLLKNEAQGYRDSQSSTNTKSYLSKKKMQLDNLNNYEIVNKECFGALVTLSKRAVQNSAALMKISNFTSNIAHKEQRLLNVFVRPMIPKVSKTDKISPKKDSLDLEPKEIIRNKEQLETKQSPVKDKISLDESKKSKLDEPNSSLKGDKNVENNVLDNETKTIQKTVNVGCETVKSSLNIPTIVPIKLRQSLDVISKPVLNKNITDLSKSGMKTKILVIKPINRNRDSTQKITTPLKFQTIKLKDPSKCNSSKEEKSSDQVLVVQVPKVDCTLPRPSIPLTNTDNVEIIENINNEVFINEKDNKLIEDKEPTSVQCEQLNKIDENSANEVSLNLESTIINNETFAPGDIPVNSTVE